jgi:hypothetical protein
LVLDIELDHVLAAAEEYYGWLSSPPHQIVDDCRTLAKKLAAKSDDKSTEAAALFFAFSVDKRFESEHRQIPNFIVAHAMLNGDIDASSDELDNEVIGMQERIRRCELLWAEVERWFNDHAVSAKRER